ncbi:hypothetical protein SCACP_20410 [Sporomusa carbonis]|uniref:peptidoglycan-binding protein n=1 Tax=Sporomusa carbonis TaxID=3076075 RepID=UPI003A7852AA
MKRAFWAVILAFAVLLGLSTPTVGLAAPPGKIMDGEFISVGMRGDDVRMVQKFLAEAGFYAGDIDGVFGPVTARAVKEFQISNNLNANGVVDKETFMYLARLAGEPSRYSRSLVMQASAYTAYDPGNGNYTYRGNRLRKGLVAVDPSVIPLGTRLYIKGYGYAIADDIGGSIEGNRIDLAFDSRSDALDFGVQKVTVYVID